jgi:hypothetical protein
MAATFRLNVVFLVIHGPETDTTFSCNADPLLWNGIFCRKPSIAEPGWEEVDDRSRSSMALDRAPV